MGTELTKSNNTHLALHRQQSIITLMSSGKMVEVSELLPKKIEDALDEPPICELMKQVPERSIEAFLAIELNKAAAAINIDSRLNLQKHQIPTIAQEILNTFSRESLADFTICLRRGAMGLYGEIYRLDGAIVISWIKAYLEEKYQAIETRLMKEKNPAEDQNLITPRGSDFNVLDYWMKVNGVPKQDNSHEYARHAVEFESKRKNFTVTVEDSEGNYIGKYENVLAETQEQANEIVKKLIEQGKI